MNRRSCATCKHYQRSSMPRMGWCRNPQLYDPQHNHLVSSDDLDCDRGTGDYWQPVSAGGQVDGESPPIITVTSSGAPVYQVSGSSGYGSDPPPPGEGGGSPWSTDDRDFGYYEEERYWTDYLRIAAPILGVIVLVILLWFWIASFLGDGNDDDDAAGLATSTEQTLPTLGPTPDATEGAPGDSTPPPDATAPDQTPDATQDPSEPTQPPTGNGDDVGIYLGAIVEVYNTDGAGVNVRAEATTESEILSVFLDGTQITVIGGPVEAEEFTWWLIQGNEIEAGWIVDTYLQVIE